MGIAHMTPAYEQIGFLERRVAELEYENDSLRAEIDPCRQYQKDGESLAECLERNRRDAGRALRLYGEVKAENELYRWLKENSDYASTVVGNIEITDAAIGAAVKGER